jgi:hypothetical protein
MNENLAEDFATGWEPSTPEMVGVYLAVIIMLFILVAVAKRDYRNEQEKQKDYWPNVKKAPLDTSRESTRTGNRK